MAIFGGRNITIRGTKFYGNMITNIRVQNCCGNTPVGNLTVENNWFGPPLQGDGVSPAVTESTSIILSRGC